MARQARRFKDAPAVDAHVHHNGAVPHAGNHGLTHEHGCARSITPNRANRNVRRAQGLFQNRGLQRRRPEPLTHRVLEPNQPVHRVVEDLDACTESQRRTRGVFPHCSCAKDDDLAGTHATDAAQHGALTAVARHQFSRQKHGRVARNLSHGANQGLNAVFVLDKVPGNGGGFLGAEGFEKPLVLDAQLKGRNERLAHTHQLDLFQRRRLDLEDDVRLKHLTAVVHDACARLTVVVVGELRLRAGLGFHQDLVPVRDQQRHGFRHEGHPLFLQARFGGNANGELSVALFGLQQFLLGKKGGLAGEGLDGFAS